MTNLLHTQIDYRITQTGFGTWKRYLYQGGALYQEFTSDASVRDWPLLQIASGRNPETGKVTTACVSQSCRSPACRAPHRVLADGRGAG
ncbi:MAG: hypothetical protein HZA90_25085 [Verrucomicrobia bacterium]|nr:hypothetical protein [Verrucomicrobiota bacterium]